MWWQAGVSLGPERVLVLKISSGGRDYGHGRIPAHASARDQTIPGALVPRTRWRRGAIKEP